MIQITDVQEKKDYLINGKNLCEVSVIDTMYADPVAGTIPCKVIEFIYVGGWKRVHYVAPGQLLNLQTGLLAI